MLYRIGNKLNRISYRKEGVCDKRYGYYDEKKCRRYSFLEKIAIKLMNGDRFDLKKLEGKGFDYSSGDINPNKKRGSSSKIIFEIIKYIIKEICLKKYKNYTKN